MSITRIQRSIYSFLGLCLILLLAACSSNSSNNPTPTAVGGTPSAVGKTPTAAGTTPAATPPPKLPPVLTSCPASGTARASIMSPLTLGSHQNVVYVVNEYQGQKPTFGTLKRYDVTTGNKTEIVKIANASINDAQISQDGQWVLFTVAMNGTQKLQLVRMDGQELQTLYCGNSIYYLQWSANQQLIAFVNFQNASDFYVLNTQSGSLQRVFHAVVTGGGIAGYRIESWLDATRLYVLTQPLDQPADTLSILDVTKGTDQGSKDLQSVFHLSPSQSGFCWSNDSSYDGATLFTSLCSGGDPRGGTTAGPGTITAQPATGGAQQTIYSSSTLAITSLRTITNNELFYIVANTSGDTSHNGLWKINADGTGNTFLTSINGNGSNSLLFLNSYTQYPWSNFSRDGSMYALLQITVQRGSASTFTLYTGSLNGGQPTSFASIAGTELQIVGWTTM